MSDEDGWLSLTVPGSAPAGDQPPRWGRMLGGVALVALLVFVGVAAASEVLARRTAEREAVNDALQLTDVLASSVLQPALEDSLLSTNPAIAKAARERLDPIVRERLLNQWVVRVKLWTAQGEIVYSDEPRLIGGVFELDDEEREVFTDPATKAEVSDLEEPENRFENGQKLLEVYRPVWTPAGKPLLFETYSAYDAVTARTTSLWRGFGGITLTSLLLLLVAQAPLTWALVARVRRGQVEREAWLQRAVSASDEERRRIAATLHDGAVQELAASAFLVAGAGGRVRASGDDVAAQQLDVAAASVRSSIGGLRSLLVDIYPPSLSSAGLPAALADLVAPMRSQGMQVRLEVADDIQLAPKLESLIFRVAQECLRNVVRHADARLVQVALSARDGGPVRLDVIDDGTGFDPESRLASPPEGHFGIRLMIDQANTARARLKVRSAPGAGTHWRLEANSDD